MRRLASSCDRPGRHSGRRRRARGALAGVRARGAAAAAPRRRPRERARGDPRDRRLRARVRRRGRRRRRRVRPRPPHRSPERPARPISTSCPRRGEAGSRPRSSARSSRRWRREGVEHLELEVLSSNVERADRLPPLGLRRGSGGPRRADVRRCRSGSRRAGTRSRSRRSTSRPTPSSTSSGRPGTSRPGSARTGTRVVGPRNGWVTVYDEVADVEPGALLRFAREISSRMGAVVVALRARGRPGRADGRARPRRDRRRVPVGAGVLRPAAARGRDRAGREPHRARAADRRRPAGRQARRRDRRRRPRTCRRRASSSRRSRASSGSRAPTTATRQGVASEG